MAKRIMRSFKLSEISAVDRPAQAHAKMVLMKRHDAPTAIVFLGCADEAEIERAKHLRPWLAKGVGIATLASIQAGIDGDRSGHARELFEKGLYEVSRFAEVLQSIAYLARSSTQEREYEGDHSRVPEALKSWLQSGTSVFRDMADEEIGELIADLHKREFSAAERKADAKDGSAMPDGSFPIKNASDLANARKLAGHAKDPAAARRHIEARAKALGLTSKGDTSMLGKAFAFVKGLGSARTRLEKSIQTIVDDPTVADKGPLIAETIAQFGEHVEKLAGADPVDPPPQEDGMSVALKKALGLSETATEAEMLAAVAKRENEIAVMKADLSAPERAHHDALPEGERAAFRALSKAERAAKLAPPALSATDKLIEKLLSDQEDLRKRLENSERRERIQKFETEALDLGLPRAAAEVLMKAEDGDKGALATLKQMLKSATAAADMGQVFKEFGSAGGQLDPSDPMAPLWAKADELVKLDPTLTREQAFAKVYENPANRNLAKAERGANRPSAN